MLACGAQFVRGMLQQALGPEPFRLDPAPNHVICSVSVIFFLLRFSIWHAVYKEKEMPEAYEFCV